jgi:quinol monooxygenase YgiN
MENQTVVKEVGCRDFESVRIEKVNNGWILYRGYRDQCLGFSKNQYVFHTTSELAAFIQDNF